LSLVDDPRPARLQLTPIEQSSFVIASNGFVDGPAQALRDYLLARRAGRLTMILHPLLDDE
jgi:hypothetical protein